MTSASPASRHHEAVLEAIAQHLPGAGVLVAAGRGRFGRSVAAVAGALAAFADELGQGGEGVIAPSQWEESLRFVCDVGPTQAHVVRALRTRIIPSLGSAPTDARSTTK